MCRLTTPCTRRLGEKDGKKYCFGHLKSWGAYWIAHRRDFGFGAMYLRKAGRRRSWMHWSLLNWVLRNVIKSEATMAHHLWIELVFELNSGVHVTGERAKLWTDKALVVDWSDGTKPIVPATTLKGWLREAAERILRGFGLNICDSSRADTVCSACLVCEVFGAPRLRSPIRFADAILEDPATDVRMNVSLSRHRKTAYEERLFSTEVAWSSRIRARIEGWLDSQERALQAAALLLLAAKAGYAIGAARSRGLGWIRLVQWTVKVMSRSSPKRHSLSRCAGWGSNRRLLHDGILPVPHA